jgi:hypothetical protein
MFDPPRRVAAPTGAGSTAGTPSRSATAARPWYRRWGSRAVGERQFGLSQIPVIYEPLYELARHIHPPLLTLFGVPR